MTVGCVFKFTAVFNVQRGHPPEPNAIVRCTGFSISADPTHFWGRSRQVNFHTATKPTKSRKNRLGSGLENNNGKPRQVNKKEW
jgi:hypothetical protein